MTSTLERMAAPSQSALHPLVKATCVVVMAGVVILVVLGIVITTQVSGGSSSAVYEPLDGPRVSLLEQACAELDQVGRYNEACSNLS